MKSRLGIGLIAALVAGAAAAPSIGPSQAASPPHGEILWDSFGVPHIYGRTEAAVFEGFGWAQARSHGNLLLHLYGESRGRAAEYWGASFAAQDRWLIANDVPNRAALWYKAQTPSFRADLDAFAAGINAYAAAHRDQLDPSVRTVLPVSGVDVVAHAHRLMNYVYIASEKKALQDPATNEAGGSNAWAVAPSRSADGHTLLLANPHLPWATSMLTYYEAQLNGPGISFYGATQVGLPVLRFGFNNDLGFTNTVNDILGSTSYRLTLAPGGYMFDGEVRRFREKQASYKVRQPDGTLTTEHFTLRRAVQGPAFTRSDGSVIAVKVAGLDRPGMLQEYWAMDRAHDWAQFQAAIRTLQVPSFNIVYGDRAGHVLYFDNGILPRYPGGDYAHWAKPVAGDTSRTLWTGIFGYDALPRVFDPPSGFVQNANDPPWVSTWPQVLHRQDYPATVAPTTPMSMRAQMSTRLLFDRPKISFDDFVAAKLTTRSLMADRLLPALVPLAEHSADPELRDAAALLKGWDHRFEADARGALLFETWAALFMPAKFSDQRNYATPWSEDAPISTPDGLKDPAFALSLLKQAVARTRMLYGAVDRPFGDVSRFHLGDVDLPGNGGFGNTGVFRTITWGPMQNGERTPLHGETWVSMVEFSTPMKAVGLLSYGNASQPGSPHHNDQLRFLSTKTFRTLWITRPEVENHLEDKTVY